LKPYYTTPNGILYCGDCLETLKVIPDKSVNCCVTSPPYWGLRDYGNDEQLGLEATPDEYIKKMVAVFHEVKRVLRDDGTLWLNVGDSYSTGTKAKRQDGTLNLGKGTNKSRKIARIGTPDGCKTKDLVGIPWMLAFALRADGWYLRQDIIWHKPNPMPESVRDRCTKAHEYIFLLSKSKKYFYDYEAIKEPVADSSKQRLGQKTLSSQIGSDRVPFKTNGPMKAVGSTSGRNKRSVWTVNTKPYKEAHFATFPEDLIIPCIKAGCPDNGTVLDPFFGAGTTGLVAEKLCREWVGLELNEEYCAIAADRIEQEARQLKLFA
jgi:DNA modification methylase